MDAGLILQIILVAAGVLIVCITLLSLAKSKMTESFCLMWSIRNCVNSRGNHASSCRMGSVCKSGRASVDSDSDLLWNSLFVFCDMPGIGAYAKGK